MFQVRERDFTEDRSGTISEMYARAALSGEMALPPDEVVPSGSLNANRCVEDTGRVLIVCITSELEASSSPWMRGTNTRESPMRDEGFADQV